MISGYVNQEGQIFLGANEPIKKYFKHGRIVLCLIYTWQK